MHLFLRHFEVEYPVMTVGSITAQSSNGFSTWTADIPLSLGLNTISVTAIMAIDLSTGTQPVLSASSQTNTENNSHYPQSVTIDTTRKRAFIL